MRRQPHPWGQVLVGDADRSHVAELLQRYYALGYLPPSTFEQRVEAAYRASVRAELDAVLWGLPPLPTPPPPPSRKPRQRRRFRALAAMLVAAVGIGGIIGASANDDDTGGDGERLVRLAPGSALTATSGQALQAADGFLDHIEEGRWSEAHAQLCPAVQRSHPSPQSFAQAMGTVRPVDHTMLALLPGAAPDGSEVRVEVEVTGADRVRHTTTLDFVRSEPDGPWAYCGPWFINEAGRLPPG